MNDKVKQYLAKTGHTPEAIQLFESGEFDPDKQAAAYLEGQRKVYENDTEIKTRLEKEITGRVTGSTVTKLKRGFGLSAEDTKDKNLEGVVDVIIERNSRKPDSDDEKQKQLDEYAEKIQDIEYQLEKLRTETMPRALEESTAVGKQRLLAEKLNNRLRDFRLNIESTENAQTYLLRKVRKTYNLGEDESGEFIFLDEKGNTILSPNDKSRPMNLVDVMHIELEKSGLLNLRDNRTTTRQSGGNEEPSKPAERDRAQEKASLNMAARGTRDLPGMEKARKRMNEASQLNREQRGEQNP